MDKSEEAASLTATRAGGGVMNEQEQFEAWVNSLNPGWLLDKTKNDGDYAFPRAYAGWQAWQAAKADQQARIESLTEGIKRTTALYNDLENAEIEGDDESCGVIRHQLDRSIEDMAALLEEGE